MEFFLLYLFFGCGWGWGLGVELLLLIQAPVVQRVDNAIHRINCYPGDKCWQHKLHYPLDSDLSGG